MTDSFHTIETNADIEHFIDKVNGLHDAYLIGTQYTHKGITGANPYWIDYKQTELRLRFLITSIYSAVVELVFTGLDDWQLKENSSFLNEVALTAVSFTDNGHILWTDDAFEADYKMCNLYVLAEKMEWRFVSE